MKLDLYNDDFFNLFNDEAPKCDIIITDMPYGTTAARWDTPIDLERFWDRAEYYCGGRVLAFAQTPFDKVLGFSNLDNLRYELIWEKTSATGHLNAKKCPMKAHENILVFGSVPYYPQMSHGHVRKTARKKGDGSVLYGKQKMEGLIYDSTSRYPRSVIKFASDKQRSKLHPTQKPLALMEYLVLTYTKPGDIVLDPFMGSGTTGLACLKHGRGFIGVEKDADYFQTATQRLNAINIALPA